MSNCKTSYLKIALGLAAAGLAASLLSTPAAAADLDYGFGPESPSPPEEKVEFGSGWYIRGDIGATRGVVPKTQDDPYNWTPGKVYYTGVDVNRGVVTQIQPPAGIFEGPGRSAVVVTGDGSQFGYTASLGGGYQFNKWFRSDVVFDFIQPHKTSLTGVSRPCVIGMTKVTITTPQGTGQYSYPTLASCTPYQTAALNSYDALVNGYIDLGTWGRVTPYVGAGLGLSFGYASASSTYKMSNGAAYQVSFTDPLTGVTYNQNWDRKNSTQYYNLAYALMAGMAFDVFDHTKLDIGYRFVGLGKVLGVPLNSQEVRAGLRYMIDN